MINVIQNNSVDTYVCTTYVFVYYTVLCPVIDARVYTMIVSYYLLYSICLHVDMTLVNVYY